VDISQIELFRRYIHYTELGRSWTYAFKCINISDLNIEKIFEILGIQLSVDIILTVYSLFHYAELQYRKERYVQYCFQLYEHFRHEYEY
jgi:hypothetical protein